jgi:DNA-binding NarL/FixJ family response regulator
VGEQRLAGRRRLADGDVLRLGAVRLAFRAPAAARLESTHAAGGRAAAPELTPAQRRVLVALCRPLRGGARDASPATNPQIAAELVLSVAAVKTHLRAICRAFGIDELPQQEKRRRLVALAFAAGVVREHDL